MHTVEMTIMFLLAGEGVVGTTNKRGFWGSVTILFLNMAAVVAVLS